jgi:hypothetical protein
MYDFQVSSSASQTVLRGSQANYSVALSLLAGSSKVNLPNFSLGASGVPPDSSYAFSPSIISGTSIASSGVSYSTLSINTKAAGSLGDYSFQVVGAPSFASSTRSSPAVQLHIFDYSISVAPTGATTIMRDQGKANYDVAVSLASGSSVVGLPSAISLSLSGTPSDSTTSLASSISFPQTLGSSSTTNLTITAGAILLGDYSPTVTGAVSGGTRASSAALHIYAVTVSLSPTKLSVLESGTASYSVTVALASGSTTVNLPTIDLSVTGLPTGVSSSFVANSGPASGFSTTLNIQASKTVTLGSYSLSVLASDGNGGSSGTQVTLTIVYPLTVTNLSPSNGARVSPRSVSFSVNVTSLGSPVEGASVTIYANGALACTATSNSAGLATCSDTLSSNANYSWYAVATYPGYTNATSTSWTFSTY